MNSIARSVMEFLDQPGRPIVEYGNLRAVEPWGSLEDDDLSFTFEFDFIAVRPLYYKVIFNMKNRTYSCVSKLGGRGVVSSVIQFSTDQPDVLRAKIIDLVEHIPNLRERMLKEYIFNLADKAPTGRWINLFGKDTRKTEYLEGVIGELAREERISEGEKRKLLTYAESLS